MEPTTGESRNAAASQSGSAAADLVTPAVPVEHDGHLAGAPEHETSDVSGPERPEADVDRPQRDERPATFEPAERIVAQLGALDSLDSLPLSDHADVYQRVHSELQSALAEIDGS